VFSGPTAAAAVPDRRSACGLRHPLVVILTLSACATARGRQRQHRGDPAVAARTSQAVLERLGAYRDPFTGLLVVPSERPCRGTGQLRRLAARRLLALHESVMDRAQSAMLYASMQRYTPSRTRGVANSTAVKHTVRTTPDRRTSSATVCSW
jgi:hypothetical protein